MNTLVFIMTGGLKLNQEAYFPIIGSTRYGLVSNEYLARYTDVEEKRVCRVFQLKYVLWPLNIKRWKEKSVQNCWFFIVL